MDTFEITYGEAMQIDRRRREETQRQAAARLSMSTYQYRELEQSEHRPRNAPKVSVRAVTDPERFRTLRLREGLTQRALAPHIEVSVYWLIQMEDGRQNCDRLAAFWGQPPRRLRAVIESAKREHCPTP